MRFMMLAKANRDSEAGVRPSMEFIEVIRKFNQEMADAGVLLATDALQASSMGTRVTFTGGQRLVTDGPFTEVKELVAGYWIIQVNSKEEAIQWALRAPCPQGEDRDGEIEIRQIIEASDFYRPEVS